MTEVSKRREKFIIAARNYEWADTDIEKIAKALEKAADNVRKSFVPPQARGVFKL